MPRIKCFWCVCCSMRDSSIVIVKSSWYSNERHGSLKDKKYFSLGSYLTVRKGLGFKENIV